MSTVSSVTPGPAHSCCEVRAPMQILTKYCAAGNFLFGWFQMVPVRPSLRIHTIHGQGANCMRLQKNVSKVLAEQFCENLWQRATNPVKMRAFLKPSNF